MIKMRHLREYILLATLFLPSFFVVTSVSAQYTGTNYKIEEAQVGAAGGDNDLQSGAYRGRAGVGDTAVGIVNGGTYQAVGGFTTSDIPELEISVNTPTLNLGNASVSAPLTGTANFGVRVYLASGYVVYTRGGPPAQESGYTMTGMTTTGTSSPGTEQFGINLVANTSPASFGVLPQQLPDASFSFGSVAANYNTANNFRYVEGEAIAQSTQSSGVTNYTISYLVNIRNTTPAGLYTMNHQTVVVATY